MARLKIKTVSILYEANEVCNPASVLPAGVLCRVSILYEANEVCNLVAPAHTPLDRVSILYEANEVCNPGQRRGQRACGISFNPLRG